MDKNILSAKQAANYLGISYWLILELVRKKVIPFDKKTIEYYYNLYNKVKGEITN